MNKKKTYAFSQKLEKDLCYVKVARHLPSGKMSCHLYIAYVFFLFFSYQVLVTIECVFFYWYTSIF